MVMEYPLDEKQAQAFFAAFARWRERLGLTDWQCARQIWSDGGTISDSNAMVSFAVENRTFTLTCNLKWLIPVTAQNIEYVAFHEALHLVLADFWKLGHTWTPPHIDAIMEREEHRIIARLNNAFAPLFMQMNDTLPPRCACGTTCLDTGHGQCRYADDVSDGANT